MRLLTVVGLSFLLMGAPKAEPYSGRLKCSELPSILGFMPGEVAIQCELALKACNAAKYFKALKPQHPLYPIMKERLEDYNNLSFEICELAIAVVNPDYYSEKLKRRP